MSDYIVIDISCGPQAERYAVRHTDCAPELLDDLCRTSQLWLRRIPAGTFVMGSPETELGRYRNESRHSVTFTKDFWMGVFPVTQRQWELIMDDNPSYFKTAGPTAPVEMVTYIDICRYNRPWPYVDDLPQNSFIGRLRRKTCLHGIDLPTDAQWEYACRAGTSSPLCNGIELDSVDAGPELGQQAWYAANSERRTHAVGQKAPNGWGLYDMLGNVWEWCRDWNSNPDRDETDPAGPHAGFSRVMRGGCWYCRAAECRCARRYDDDEARKSRYLGFRLEYGN